MNLEEIRNRLSEDENDLWWNWRYFTSAHQLKEDPGDGYLDLVIDCLIRLINGDSDWAMGFLKENGPGGFKGCSYMFSKFLDDERFNRLVNAIESPAPLRTALIRVELINAVANWWKAKRQIDALRRAWDELAAIPEQDRDKRWIDAALLPTSYINYPLYRELAMNYLAGDVRDFYRGHFLPDACEAAARHKDWDTFQAWAKEYRSLHSSFQSGHNSCILLNLEGLHALEENRIDDAEQIMCQLMEVSKGDEFISNENTSIFPRLLKERGLLLDLVEAFEQRVEQQDWRRQTRKKP